MYVKTKQKVSKYESTSTYKIIMKGNWNTLTSKFIDFFIANCLYSR